MPLWTVLASQVALALGVALVGGISVTFASAALYGTEFPDAPLLVAAGFVLSALSFSAPGVFLGSVLPTAPSAQSAALMLFFVMF